MYQDLTADLSGQDLANYLQSIQSIGYVQVTKSGDCASMNYAVNWYSGGDKSPLSVNIIANTFRHCQKYLQFCKVLFFCQKY
jgi:hypothetical protein